MFSSIRSFLSRHRRKFVVTGLIIGGSVFLSRFAQRLIYSWQERQMKALLRMTRKQRHYEGIERTCNETILTLIPSIQKCIAKLIASDVLIEELKTGGSNNLTVWQSLKIMSFTKITLLVYLSTMLVVTLRIQLSVVGGYMFKDLEEDGIDKINSEMQSKYLTLCEHLTDDGASQLFDVIMEKVNIILKDKSLKEKLTLAAVEHIFWNIHTAVSNDPRDPFNQLPLYVLPPDADKDFPENPAYGSMILETKDLLESEEVISLTNSCFRRGLAFVMDIVSEFFTTEPKQNGIVESKAGTSKSPDLFFTSNMTVSWKNEVTSVEIALAKLIPIINGLACSNGSKNDVSSQYIRQLILMDDLKTLGANIYETFAA